MYEPGPSQQMCPHCGSTNTRRLGECSVCHRRRVRALRQRADRCGRSSHHAPRVPQEGGRPLQHDQVREVGAAVREMVFPDGFLWGASTSGYQTEGGGDRTDWWAFEQSGRVPQSSGRACDSWNLWPRDLDLAVELGLNTYRISVEWARIEPEHGRFDADALAHYVDVVRGIRARGMSCMVVLWHFTLPDVARPPRRNVARRCGARGLRALRPLRLRSPRSVCGLVGDAERGQHLLEPRMAQGRLAARAPPRLARRGARLRVHGAGGTAAATRPSRRSRASRRASA